ADAMGAVRISILSRSGCSGLARRAGAKAVLSASDVFFGTIQYRSRELATIHQQKAIIRSRTTPANSDRCVSKIVARADRESRCFSADSRTGFSGDTFLSRSALYFFDAHDVEGVFARTHKRSTSRIRRAAARFERFC